VTIVKNDLDGFMRTRTSLDVQNYQQWKHVVVVASIDDSTSIVVRLLKMPQTLLVVQRGSGIYSAMNQGIEASTNEYLVFLNAGDEFADRDSLEYAIRSLELRRPSWAVFGGFVDRDGSRTRIYPILEPTPRLVGFGRAGILHPSVYYQRKFLIDLGKYNQVFEIAGDLDLNIRAAAAAVPEVYARPVSVFYADGVSSTRVFAAINESWRARASAHATRPFSTRVGSLVYWLYQFIRLFVHRSPIGRMVNAFRPHQEG